MRLALLMSLLRTFSTGWKIVRRWQSLGEYAKLKSFALEISPFLPESRDLKAQSLIVLIAINQS